MRVITAFHAGKKQPLLKIIRMCVSSSPPAPSKPPASASKKIASMISVNTYFADMNGVLLHKKTGISFPQPERYGTQPQIGAKHFYGQPAICRNLHRT